LERLRKILRPIDCDIPPFARIAKDLSKRAGLFSDLRAALRLDSEDAGSDQAEDAQQKAGQLHDVREAVETLTASLKELRPERGPAKDMRRAIDIILTHIDRHGPYLWGHAIRCGPGPGEIRLVDRTNNILEGCFRTMKHGERRRSGRKVLTQDFEQFPPAAALAANLARPDYVSILCGSLQELPQAFAKLDEGNNGRSLAARCKAIRPLEVETASMSLADRRLVRSPEMERMILAAAAN
jgi:hypothetical protein